MRKFLNIFIAAVMLAAACTFGGCDAGDIPEQSTPATTGSADSSVMPEDTTGATGSDAPAPFDISTPGGAVIVGGVKKDSAGFYLETDTQLDIALDGAGGFRGVSRIRFYADERDGVIKTEYLGSIVTVSGRLCAEANELYISPYKIEYGKRAAASCAAPDLEPMTDESVVYDPAAPLPPKMQPVVINGKYEYNPYMLSTAALRFMGNDFADFYISFIDAYLNYETSLPCSSKRYAYFLPTVLEKEFPLYGAEIEIDTTAFFDPANGVIRWGYKTGSRAEHDALVSAFYNEVSDFLGVRAAADEKERAMAVYHNITTRVKYDYSIMKQEYAPGYNPAFRAYHERTGICSTFARTYQQMLAQVGIDAEYSGSDMRGEVVGHAWVTANIDGKNYFFDPTYELSTSAGQGYIYFGMTLAKRLSGDPRIIESTVFVGTYEPKPVGDVVISDTPLAVR